MFAIDQFLLEQHAVNNETDHSFTRGVSVRAARDYFQARSGRNEKLYDPGSSCLTCRNIADQRCHITVRGHTNTQGHTHAQELLAVCTRNSRKHAVHVSSLGQREHHGIATGMNQSSSTLGLPIGHTQGTYAHTGTYTRTGIYTRTHSAPCTCPINHLVRVQLVADAADCWQHCRVHLAATLAGARPDTMLRACLWRSAYGSRENSQHSNKLDATVRKNPLSRHRT